MGRRFFYALLLVLSVMGFQNCSPGFVVTPEATALLSLGMDLKSVSALASRRFLDQKIVDSSGAGYTHSYGPTILYENGVFHAFYCSSGLSLSFVDPLGNPTSDWDSIRYISSTDGITWSAPVIALKTTNFPTERCACDPSVVFYKGYYYLFYSGNAYDRQTVMFVARSTSLKGPFAKWDGANWNVDSQSPAVIMGPLHDVPEAVAQRSPWYGAGQQTVVVLNGTLHSWFTDDTSEYPTTNRNRIYHATSNDGVTWNRAVTNVVDTSSVDVKYDELNSRFVMFDTADGHQKNVTARRRTSQDGISWSDPEVICDEDCMPNYANNIGVSGDREGKLLEPYTLIAFGAPYDLSGTYSNRHCMLAPQGNCWGRWDLYGSYLPTQPSSASTDEYCHEVGDLVTVASTEAKTVLTGWPVERIADEDPSTIYSSEPMPDLTNTRRDEVILRFAQQRAVKEVHISARIHDSVIFGFPLRYNVFVTSSDNSNWINLGEFSEQPAADGQVHLILSQSYSTYGVRIVPTQFKTNDPAGQFFQLGGVSPIYYETVCH